MKHLFSRSLIFASLTFSLPASEKLAELKLKDGTVLKRVEIREYSAKGIRAIHDGGGGFIAAVDLPDELQKKCVDAPTKQEVKAETRQRLIDEGNRQTAIAQGKESPVRAAPPTGPVCRIGPIALKVIAIRPGVADIGTGRIAGYLYTVEAKNTSTQTLGFDLEMVGVRGDGRLSPGDPLFWDMKLPPGGSKTLRAEMLLAPGGEYGLSSISATITTDSGKDAVDFILIPANAKETGLFVVPSG